MSTITLTTDFGWQDAYVAAMKGVILGLNPQITLVDVTHSVRPGDVQAASFLLLSSVPFFNSDTVHMCVVDPGVGSSRKILCAASNHGYIVVPDNGCLTALLEHKIIHRIREVKNSCFFRSQVSSTFHGRDIMAPVSAHLSQDPWRVFEDLGPLCSESSICRIQSPQPQHIEGGLKGQVVAIDHFGNVITNLREVDVKKYQRRGNYRIRLGQRAITKQAQHYAVDLSHEPFSLINSLNLLEIAIPRGSAQKSLGAYVGQEVVVERGSREVQ